MAQKTSSYYVNTASLNVRQAASTDSKVIGKVTQDMLIQVISIQNGWAYISYGKGFGYVSSKYITPKKGADSSSRTTTSSSKSTPSKVQSSYNGVFYSDGLGPHYSGRVGTGTIFTSGAGGPFVDVVNGCQIRDYIFVGGGVGLHTGFSSGVGLFTIPIFANARGTFRVKENIAPFVDFAIGGYLGWNVYFSSKIREYLDIYSEYLGDNYNYKTNNFGGGFYTHVLAGVNLFQHWNVSMGYERCGGNMGVIRLEYNW